MSQEESFMRETQISAFVSTDTKELLDRLVRSTGLKKGYVLEMALRHHVQALQEIPSDLIVPPRIVITRESGERLISHLRDTRPPRPALRRLMTHGRQAASRK
jgi:uncharacterized protein (DUF1778 family)